MPHTNYIRLNGWKFKFLLNKKGDYVYGIKATYYGHNRNLKGFKPCAFDPQFYFKMKEFFKLNQIDYVSVLEQERVDYLQRV